MKLPKNQPNLYARKILWGFLGLLIAGSVSTFLLLHESALYFLLHPQVLLSHLKNGARIPANIELEIVKYPSGNKDRHDLVPETIETVNQIARDITVKIKNDRNNQNGSGAIVAKTQNTDYPNTYYIVTAKHVVGKQTDYSVVTPDGESYPVNEQAIEKFAGVDLAILQFRSEKNYSVAILGDYHLQYDAMGWVFLSGWPIVKKINYANSAQHEFNAGRLFSSEFGSLQITDRDLNQGYELVYTNFSKAGISGGPILDTEGRVIGIHGASRVDRLHKVQLGDSLGVPIQRFLGLINQGGIPQEFLQIETSHPAKSTQAASSDAGILAEFSLQEPSDPKNYRHWVNYGNQLWRMGLNQGAIDAFEKAIKIQPNFYPAWYLQGLVLKEEQQYAEALASFERVMKIQPKLIQGLKERGEVFARLGDYPNAIASIEQGLEMNSQDFIFHWLRGNWLYESKRYVKAIAAYTDAINLKSHPLVYYNRGVARYSLKDYSGAIADFDAAIQYNFKHGKTYLGRGFAYLAQGNQQKAQQDLAQAQKLFCETGHLNCENLPGLLKQLGL